MSKYIVNGGKALNGAVRLGGAKNASFKLMIAATLAETESKLLNLSHIGDVDVTQKTLKVLGCQVAECGERTLSIKPSKFSQTTVPQFSGEKSRASTLLAAVLLSQKGEAIIPEPGGCVLGSRPIDRHLDAFRHLGVTISSENTHIHLSCPSLYGTTYRFSKKTHTGTEALILLAVKARGKTIIQNAGQEPEIDDLIDFLNKMGAKIQRQPDESILIDGVKQLHGAIHQVMPDRNEAVSYAIAALATKGDIVVENARAKDLHFFLEKLTDIGAKYEISDYGIRFYYHQQLKPSLIKTAPEPGFMTDWQPLWGILMTQANGESEIIEAVHNNRLQYVDQLNKMGANIHLFNPVVDNPNDYYEFDNPKMDPNFHACAILGPTPLHALNLDIPDLRAGATLTIAALIAQGKSELSNISHIERGYENLDERLAQLGADIQKV